MVIIVFKGEKTYVFWIGLIVLGYAISQLSMAINYLIMFALSNTPSALSSFTYTFWIYIANGIVFLIISLYMMKSGTKKQVAQANTV